MIKIVAVGKIKEKFSKAQIEEFEKRLRPVSYTHLDVYKRQVRKYVISQKIKLNTSITKMLNY